jgi:hypothetical protein
MMKFGENGGEGQIGVLKI